MDLLKLSQEIINGKRLTRNDDLSFFVNCDFDELCDGANKIRKELCGDHVDLCTIINGKSGKCSENCKFCAQSAHNCTGIKEYSFLNEEEIIRECKNNASKGVHHYSIVTAGRSLSGEDFEKAIHAYTRMHNECDINLCGSHGLLTDEQFERLYNSGVKMYHCNIETSERNFPNICTTHSYREKIENIARAKKAGFAICSGGIIGMGETWEDRIDMAVSLAEVGVDSIPINALMPIKGTPMENNKQLSGEEILRTVAIFRYINPTVYIRLAAGRNLMENSGEKAFFSGANATITGDMLTTSGSSIKGDIDMLSNMGFDVQYRREY